jgi:hypothetical protein
VIERGHALRLAASDLSDDLRNTITLHKIARLISPTPRSGFYLNGPDLADSARRLQIAVELTRLPWDDVE